MVDFPHLNDSTAFPFQPEPDVYTTYRNTFDYTQWSAGTRVTLCGVPWDAAYENVVGWSDDAARDKWFEDLDASTGECARFTLAAPARIMDGSITIPLPYDTGSLYNYAWVEMAATPGESQSTNRVDKWGFFITGYEYHSPAATGLTLTVDWWTSFINRVTISRVQLRRGHWAVANSATVSDFLADPMTHTTNLMDDEGDELSLATRWHLKSADSWQSGSQVAVLDCGAWDPDADSDTDTATTFPAIDGFTATDGTPTGTLISCAKSDVQTLLSAAPTPMLMAMQALYIVPERFLSFQDTAITIGGVTCRRVLSFTTTTTDIQLTEEDYGYPSTAKSLTKLYTSQYARAHVVKEDGTAIDLPIERITSGTHQTASLRIDQGAARIMTYLTPIGDSSEVSYYVARLDSTPVTVRGGAWQATTLEWTLPTYGVWLDAAKETAWTRKAARAQARDNAETAYDNAVDAANTAKRIADASAWQAWNNSKRDNDTTQTNTNESASTANANTRRSALTSYDNTSDEITASTLDLAINTTSRNAATTNTNATARLTLNEATHKTQHEQQLSLSYQADQVGITLATDTGGNIVYDADGTFDPSKVGSGLWTTWAQAQSAAQLGYQQTTISTEKQREVLTLQQGTSRFNTAMGMINRTSSGVVNSVTSAATGSGLGEALVDNGWNGGNSLMEAGVANATSIAQTEVGIHSQDLQMDVVINANGELTDASMAHMFGGVPGGGTNTVNPMAQTPSIPDYALTSVTAAGYNLGNLNISYAGTIYQNRKDRVYTVTTNRGNIQHSQAQTGLQTAINDLNTANANTLNSVNTQNRRALVMGGTRQTLTTGTQDVQMNLAYGSDHISQTMNTLGAGTGQAMTGTAPRTRDTAYTNADATLTTTTGNAARTRATQKTNTYGADTTSMDNAERSRITTVGGSYAYTVVSRDADNEALTGTAATATMTGTAPRTRDNALANVNAGIQTDNMGSPRLVATASDPDNWAQRPASVTVYVETPCDADVLRIADRMNTFGYTCWRTISAPQLVLMPKWTYWECERAWVRPATRGAAPNRAIRQITNALQSGVEVWDTPGHIGDAEQEES